MIRLPKTRQSAKTRFGLTAVATILLVGASPIATPAVGAEAQVIHFEEVDGTGWRVARVHADGGFFGVELCVEEPQAPAIQVVRILDAEGQALPASQVFMDRGHLGIQARINAAPIGNVSAGHGFGQPDPSPACNSVNVHQTEGTLYALAYTAGATPNWSLEIRGDTARVEAIAGGDATFLHLSEDFEGTAVADVGGLYVQGGANLHTSKRVEAKNTLVAEFVLDGFFDVGVSDMSVETPAGQVMDCPCSFRNVGPHGAEAGEYEFRLTSARASTVLGIAQRIVLHGADARLPP